MAKWADLLANAIKHDKDLRVTHVQVVEDLGDTISTVNTPLTRQQAIDKLKSGVTIKTIYKGDDGKWIQGADVEYYKESNGIEYLRTKSNKTAKDNLDNLPLF